MGVCGLRSSRCLLLTPRLSTFRHPAIASAASVHLAMTLPSPQAPAATAAAPAQPPPGSAPDAASEPIGDRKLRILCLHGYMQNSEIFRSRIGSMRKALKSRAEFFFLDGPYPASPADDQSVDDSDGAANGQGRSWWQWTDLEPGTRPSRAAHYSGWQASQAAIEAALQAHAPIDGILGFSQGATAAAIFLACTNPTAGEHHPDQHPQQRQQQQNQQQQQQIVGSQQQRGRQDQLRFACIIAGFLPRDASYAAALRQGRPGLPSLHVIGSRDELVPEERSQALWECFAPGTVRTYKHGGAHMVPTCSGDFKALMVELLDEVKQGRQSEWGSTVLAAADTPTAATV